MPQNFSLQYIYAFKYLIENEGGFVNDPKDLGGATKYGVTLLTLKHWRRKPVSVNDVASLSTDEAAQIYYNKYWVVVNCHLINSERIATAVLDTCVLFGCGTGASFVQKTLNACGYPVKIDRSIGRETLKALNAVSASEFIPKFRELWLKRIDKIIEDRPASERFRGGWINRANRLLELLA